ncbi:PTS sugar transporter subunit IIA [Oceanobacillus sp. CFH 90083]|uniref:PTS sugar transporter subunit IIA n=1 Tax=Oceanobacillus sp. CFH 90083 TaxID=2592336 RepID=UPI00128DE89F|nr:PTS sugar transporter subunit IIA [Oceanobacillus sp. CFH 90083]
MKEIKFTKENVRLNVQADDWKDAIHQGVALLEHNGFVTDKYAFHIIRNIDEYGPYIVISPGIAIPHARPEDGAIDIGVSLITLKQSISFPNMETPVRVLISFAAQDNDQHLNIIKLIVKIIEDGLIQKIADISSIQKLNDLIGGDE